MPIVQALPCIQIRSAAAMRMNAPGPTNERRWPPHQSMGPRLAFALTSSVGASATCAMTLPSSLIRRPERGHAGTSSGPAVPRPIVNAQQTAVLTIGQGKKDEKGGPFRGYANPRDIYD